MEQLPPPAAARTDESLRAERLAALARRRPPAGPNAASAATARPSNPSADGRARRSNVGTSTPTRTKRRHPAQGARVAALGLSLVTTGGLATLFAFSGPTNSSQVETAQIVTGPAVGTPVPTATSPAATTPATATPSAATTPVPATSTPATVATSAPTVVDGGVFHNKWGDVQVEATFASDGTMIDVATLRTPNDRNQSVRINDVAVPRLNAEALASQSASVDTVSGATYTSNDYRRSLQSAIDAAAQSGLAVASA